MVSGSGINGNDSNRRVKDRKEGLLLLLSLLLAFIIWLLHSLSLQYSVFLEYNLEITSYLQERSRSSLSEDVLIIRGKSDGYYILKQRIGRRKTLRVQVPPESLKHKEGDVFSVRCEEIKGNIVEALGSNVQLEFIVTESLDLSFPQMISRKVPVIPKSSITYDGQYMPVGNIELRPDSIEIYGDSGLLESIDYVWTETISRTGVNGPVQGMCGIVPVRRVEFSENTVYYSLNVVRYIEESISVPVTASGVPDGKEMIVLPSEVTLTFRRVFSGERFLPENFVLSVDYGNYISTIDSELVPELVSKPDGVISWEISPRYVDCVLLDGVSDIEEK